MKVNVERVMDNLSYGELSVAKAMAENFPEGGNIVMSLLCDEEGFSRALGSSTLRKLMLAGVIESRNLGARGIMVKVLSPEAWEKLADFDS